MIAVSDRSFIPVPEMESYRTVQGCKDVSNIEERKSTIMTPQELIKIRENHNLSKADFASALGITAMLLGRMESGGCRIKEDVAAKINELYGEKPAAGSESKNTVQEKAAAKTTQKAAPKAAAKTEPKAVEEPAPRKSGKAASKPAGKAAVKAADQAAGKAPKKLPKLFIQSLQGDETTAEEIYKKVYEADPDADRIYVKPDENKAYWVSERSVGQVDLW